MEAAGITKADLARLTSISNTAIGKLVNGKSSDIAGVNLFPIADALGVSARWLLTGVATGDHDHANQSAKYEPQVLVLAQRLSRLDERHRKVITSLVNILSEP